MRHAYTTPRSTAPPRTRVGRRYRRSVIPGRASLPRMWAGRLAASPCDRGGGVVARLQLVSCLDWSRRSCRCTPCARPPTDAPASIAAFATPDTQVCGCECRATRTTAGRAQARKYVSALARSAWQGTGGSDERSLLCSADAVTHADDEPADSDAAASRRDCSRDCGSLVVILSVFSLSHACVLLFRTQPVCIACVERVPPQVFSTLCMIERKDTPRT